MPKQEIIGATLPHDARKQGPEVDAIVEAFENPRETMVAAAKAKLGEKANGMSFFFSDGTKAAGYYERLGYVPVWTALSEPKEDWCDRGDPMMMRPKIVSDRQHAASARLARQGMDNALHAKDGKYEVRDGDGRTHRLTED